MAFTRLLDDLSQIETKLEQVTASVAKAGASVKKVTQEMSTTVLAASASVTKSSRQVEKDVEGSMGHLERFGERTKQIETDLDKLLKSLRDSGRGEDKSLLGQIELYLEGVGDMSKLTNDWIGISTTFEGRLTSVGGLLQKLLPTTGQIQKQYRDFLKEIDGSQDKIARLIGELENSVNDASTTLAVLAKGFLAGEVSLERLYLQLQKIRETGLGGSEADILGGSLVDALEELDNSFTVGSI